MAVPGSVQAQEAVTPSSGPSGSPIMAVVLAGVLHPCSGANQPLIPFEFPLPQGSLLLQDLGCLCGRRRREPGDPCPLEGPASPDVPKQRFPNHISHTRHRSQAVPSDPLVQGNNSRFPERGGLTLHQR